MDSFYLLTSCNSLELELTTNLSKSKVSPKTLASS